MSTLVSVHRVVSGAINAVKAAEHLITDILKGGTFRTIDKANSGGVLEDPQTIADVNAQKIIVGSMRKAFPGLNIIGEEGKLKCMDDHTIDVDLNFFPQADETYMVDIKDLILWVDPLDGTKEYISGHPEYVTVLVGLSYMGQAIAGVVGQPFSPVSSGNPVWGIVGKGFGGFAPQSSVSNHSVLTSRSHPTIEAQARVDDWLSRGLVSEQVRMGGAGAKVMLLATSKATAYIHWGKGTKKWDSCAPEAILKSVGGTLTDTLGNPIVYTADPSDFQNCHGILATAPCVQHRSFM